MSRTTTPTAPQLEFSKPYPAQRPKLLCVKIFRLLIACEFAERYGLLAEKLVMIIAHMEDQFRYKRPIYWRDIPFMKAIGISDWKAFKAIREKAVESGFLVHQAPRKHSRRTHVYWVQIPADLADLADFIQDDGPAIDPAPSFGAAPNVTPNDAPSVPPSSPQLTPQAFYTSPSPEPEPLPLEGEEEDFGSGGEEGQDTPSAADSSTEDDAIALAISLGVGQPAETIRTALGLGASLGHVLAILRHADGQPQYRHPQRGSLRCWGGGAIWTRLRRAEYLSRPPGEGWAKADPDWTRLHAAAQEAERRAEAPKRAAEAAAKVEAILAQQQPAAGSPARSLRQLEFDFGQKLNSLTTEEILRLCQQRRGATASPGFLRLVEKSQGKPLTGMVRSRVLEAMAALDAN